MSSKWCRLWIGVLALHGVAGWMPVVAQGPTVAQDPTASATSSIQDTWGPLAHLVGRWEGAIAGALGEGRGLRSYEPVMDDLYLIRRHSSVRPPQPRSPHGDQHGELAIYSYDRARDTIVLREFMQEGFVLRYTCDIQAAVVRCDSEAVESGPGMRARLTLEFEDEFRFIEVFELAEAGGELTRLFRNTWTRVPDLGAGS